MKLFYNDGIYQFLIILSVGDFNSEFRDWGFGIGENSEFGMKNWESVFYTLQKTSFILE